MRMVLVGLAPVLTEERVLFLLRLECTLRPLEGFSEQQITFSSVSINIHLLNSESEQLSEENRF